MPRISALPPALLPDASRPDSPPPAAALPGAPLPKPSWHRLGQRAGFWLSLTLFVAVLLAGSSALLASGLLSEPAESARRLVPERLAPVAGGTNAPLPLPGFQRRGNFLTGHVTTEDGRRLHLVIDARSNTIVGASARSE